MWCPEIESLSGGQKVTLRCKGRRLSFADVVGLWQQDAAFHDFFARLLADIPFAAYLWECPPATAATAARAFEFVAIDSPALARLPPNPQTFSNLWQPTGEGVATFWNLGHDALLVAPAPRGPAGVYAHLAAFVRRAPAAQVQALWRAVGEATTQRLAAEPLWLSTSGLGVAWLHVRLDARPKYYNYEPYRMPP